MAAVKEAVLFAISVPNWVYTFAIQIKVLGLQMTINLALV